MSTTLKNKLGAYLAAYAPLITLVSTRIGPAESEEDMAPPYVVYYQDSSRPEWTYDAESEEEIGIEIDCIGTSYTNAQAIADAVQAALKAWLIPGSLIPQRVDRDDSYDVATKRHYVTLQYEIWSNGR